MSRRSPTPEQAAAIRSRVPRILLEAGAGTGKTTVLVDRYCDRIEVDGLRPEEILAFTFTDKAAAEMGERIRAELLRRARESAEGETARRLREAAHRLSGAWVMTMHAFCRRVLAAHPVAAGLDPELSVFDQATSTRLQREAFDLALEEFLTSDRDEGEERKSAAAEFAAAYGVDRLRRLTQGAYHQLRAFGQLHPELPDCPEIDPGEALARVERAAAAMFAGEFRRHAPTDEKIRRAQEIAAERHSWLKDGPGSEGYREKVAELEQLGHGSSVPVKKAVERARCEALAALLSAEFGPGAYGLAGELVRLFDRHYTELKLARSGIDYDDMQLRAADLLQREGAVRDSYRGRFREVMVDEFQDTSAAQVALISALCGPETTLFEVGDEFQSIYRFRDADLENFRAERRRLAADPDGEVLPLRGNFRSRASILAAANAFTRALIPRFRPLTVGSAEQDGGNVEDGPVAEPAVELLVTDPEGWEDEPVWPTPPPGTTATRGAEAAAVARRLAELAEAGVPRGDMVVLLRAHGTATAYVSALEQLGLAPFVVGGRGFWLGREVADATALLRAVANPLDDEGLFGALASPACAASPDALWLLRRAAGPRNEIWPLLSAYLRDEAPEDSHRLLDLITDDDRERLLHFHRNLQELRDLQRLISLPELVEEAVSRTGLDIATLTSRNGDLRWAGLRKLIRIAAEYEAAEGRDLRGLLEHGELAREVDDDGEAVVAAEGHDGVRLMTVHAAKGLEFPVVVVPELGRDPSGGATRNPPEIRFAPDRNGGWRVGMRLRRVGAKAIPAFDYDEISADEKEACVEEEMRLFYVAMTRAKERLILSGVGPKDALEEVRPSTPILHRLLDIFDTSTGEIHVPPAEPREGLDAKFGAVRVPVQKISAPDQVDECATPESATFDVAPNGDSRGRRVVDPPTQPILTPPTLPPLSFTLLAAFQADPAGFVEEFVSGLHFRSTDEGGPSERRFADEFWTPGEPGHAGSPHPEDDLAEGQNLATAFGSATHELLETALRGSGRRRWIRPGRERAEAALRGQRLASTAQRVERLLELIDGWLDSELCADMTVPTTKLRTEVPLTLVPEGHRDVMIRGSIDLFAEPVREKPTIIDYKTNRLGGRDPSDIVKEGYELQAKIYAVAVSRALRLDRLEVAFVFLERPADPARCFFGPNELAEAEREIATRVAELKEALATRRLPSVSAPSASPRPDAQGRPPTHPAAVP